MRKAPTAQLLHTIYPEESKNNKRQKKTFV